MASFAIYKIKFSENPEVNINTVELDGSSMLANAEEHFAKLFAGNIIKVFQIKDNGEPVPFPNYVWKHDDNRVYLLRLNNRQLKSLVKIVENPLGGAPNCIECTEESNPYCYAIFDNRRGRGQLAIEKTSAWNNDPDLVAEILEYALSTALTNDYKLQVSFHPKMQATRIWEYTRHRVEDLHDPITRIAFEIDNPRRVRSFNSPQEDVNAKIQAMMDVVVNSKALRGLFTLYADNLDPLKVEESIEDISEMVKVCSSNAYHLTIYFKRHKAYRCDEKVKALYKMPKGAIEGYMNGNMVLDDSNPEKQEYALVQWLDFVFEDTKNFEDDAQIHRKRKNRNKK